MDPDPLAALTGGDLFAARQLRRALGVLADHHAGTPLGDTLRRALAGEVTPRELAADADLVALAHDGMTSYAEERAALSPQERAAADREAAAVEGWAREEWAQGEGRP